MCADVPDATGGTALLRIGAPGGLLLSGGFEARGQPALRIFHDDFTDLAELAVPDHVARFFHQRVAGVVVREAVEQAGLFDEGGEGPGLGEIEGRGLVAQDVEAVFEGGLGGGEVDVIGGDDGDEVDALIRRQGGFLCHELLEAPVDARGIEEEVGAAGPGLFRIGRESAGGEFNLAIDMGGDAMDRTDEGAAPAANHCVTDFSAHRECGVRVESGGRCRRKAAGRARGLCAEGNGLWENGKWKMARWFCGGWSFLF